MLLRFHFDQQDIDLVIDPVDNPAIQSWQQHFLGRTVPVQVDALRWDPMGKKSHVPNWEPLSQEELDSRLRHHLDILGTAVVALKNLELNFPGAIPGPDEVDQHWANQSHRWFTHTQEEINFVDRVWFDKSHVWFDDPNRLSDIQRIQSMSYPELEMYRSDVTRELQIINEHIHEIENYIPLPNMGISRGSLWEIYLSDEPPCHDTNWWQMDPAWRKYHSRDHHDVIFGSQVLGKTILKSFLDDDDPTDWDTSGHYNNNGALQILPKPHRHQIYTSEKFREWIEKHGTTLNQVWYDFPVGDVKNPQVLQQVMKKLELQNFVKVSYHE